MQPVSIRTKNPGAMWPGPVATKFGSKSHEDLKDGNKAAIFSSFEQGAAAQFYLWFKSYSGMKLRDAIKKWSGNNSADTYATTLSHRVPGLSLDTIITKDFLAGSQGLAFMKEQARWEAGQPYPMTDDQWRRGQEIAFGGRVVDIPPPPDIEPAEAPSTTFWKERLNDFISIFRRN